MRERVNFKEMDPDEARKLLDGHTDVLSSMAKKEDASFKSMACPCCKGTSLEPFIDSKRPFLPQHPLPNKQLRCLACFTEFDPTSGMITKVAVTVEPG